MKDKDLLKKNTKIIIKKLKEKYGDLECFLTHKNAFELLCAVCLSAQCTDDRVNMVTPGLFRACLLYPSDAADEERGGDLGGRRSLQQ